MKFSVLINNHNYARFLEECVESVLGQSHPAHEIIVVDDGSSDDSLAVLNRYFGGNPRVKIIAQANQGQTAAIALGITNATGEVVCLLDADDRYKPDYLAALKTHYAASPKVDLTFCRYESFGKNILQDNASIWLQPQKDYDYGYTALLTYFGNIRWIGNNSSTVSLRLRLARILNLHEVAYRFHMPTMGDYAVLLGASLLGGRKFYLHRALIDYRVHEDNNSRRRRSTVDGQHKENFQDHVRYRYFKDRSCITGGMFRLLDSEIQTIPDPAPEHLECYRRIQASMGVANEITWARKLERQLRAARKSLLG